ncbi:MAG: glycoside hydrolase family 31 protein [Bacteroidota bacterium]
MEDLLQKLVDLYKHKPISIEEIDPSERYADVYTEYIPDNIQYAEVEGQKVLFHCDNGIQLRLDVVSPTIFRLRYAPKGVFLADFSYAIDPTFSAENVRIQLEEKDDHYLVATDKLKCKVEKKNMLVHFLDPQDEVICEESEGFYGRSTILEGWTEISISKKNDKENHYFGLGDKSCRLNLQGKEFENWNTDSFAYGKDTDPLYRAIPFYYGLENGKGYGIFLDNTYKTLFDFGKEEPDTIKFSTEGGELNYYFIYGPELVDVSSQYHQLCGRPELPPMWAFGFHQCRWSYFPEERVMEVAEEFRKRQIPCDAIYLDIDYMDGYRCFTWNHNYFPRPKKMIRALKEKGFQTVVMIDPGIKIDPEYEVYKDGLEKDVFCRRSNGEMMNGPVWPPDCAWPDFTDPAVRNWWGPLYKELYVDQDISGFWNDMNEPAVFGVLHKTFPDQVNHFCDGYPGDHRKAHNIYGMNMSQATYDGLKKLKPTTRPFVLTRATYAGGQRYAAVWTGDNIASWEHLKIANRQCQRLSISGFSFVGTDIGGFFGSPDGELMVRWLQMGIFHPFYRVHSIGNNTDGSTSTDEEAVAKEMADNRLDQEPWVYGAEYTDMARVAIEWRYRLLPYIYTAFRQHLIDGVPILQPLSMYDQHDPMCLSRENEFIFGGQLLVAPIIEEGRRRQKAYLPAGKWYHFSSSKAYKGQRKAKVEAPLDDIPVFVKAGTILPLYPVRQNTQEAVEQLQLFIYFEEGNFRSQLYEDAGDGYDYLKKQYSLQVFDLHGQGDSLNIRRSREGKFKQSYSTIRLTFIGLPFKLNSCQVDGQTISVEKAGNGLLSTEVPADFKHLELKKFQAV